MPIQKIKNALSPQNAKAQATQVQKEVRKHIITAISAAFAFIIALFWRDAIQAGVDSFLASVGLSGDAYLYKILAAIIVTVLAVVGIIFLARLEKKEPKTD